MATILPLAETQFNDALGVPLAGGSVYFYTPSTTTPKDTFQDALQTIPNSNPVILDSAGRAIILGSGSYRQVVYDANGNLIWDQTTSEAVVGSTSFGGTSTGSANAQVVAAGTFSGADGSTINFTAGFTNTGSMTIQVGAGGAPIAVLKNGPTGPVNLAAGDIAAGNIYSISYSVALGTFQLLQSIPPVITIASQAQAQAGTDNTTVMTPLRTNQAIASLGIPAPASQAQGDMLYATAPGVWARLPKGTAGQLVAMNAGATAPQWSDALTSSASVNTSTGATLYDVTGIPSWARRVTIILSGTGFNGGELGVRVGSNAGGILATGYSGGVAYIAASTNTGTLSNGAQFRFFTNGPVDGSLVFNRLGTSNVWVLSLLISTTSGSSVSFVSGGKIDLGANALDRIRLTSVSGTNTGSAGTMIVNWE
jgi:hypothetical protein